MDIHVHIVSSTTEHEKYSVRPKYTQSWFIGSNGLWKIQIMIDLDPLKKIIQIY